MNKRPERKLVDEDPYAELEQSGRWVWHIGICHGVMNWGPEGGRFLVWGNRKRAMKVAERLLAKYIRQELRRRAPRLKVTSDEYYKGVQTNRALEELREPELAWDREYSRLVVNSGDPRLTLLSYLTINEK